jgi:ABC-type transporter Mla subunit MlaD
MRRARGVPLPWVGAAAILVSAAFVLIVETGLYLKPFRPGGRTVYADFVRGPQLQTGDEVRLDGDIDGQVKKVGDLPGGRGIRATLTVTNDAGPIFANARAQIRAKTLLSGAFYVEVDRGTPAAGPLGGHDISMSHTSSQVEIEDITDVFSGGAVSGLRHLPAELRKAFADPNIPARTLDTVNRNASVLRGGIEAARGRDPGRDLPAVVANADKTVAALDSPTDELRTLISGAAATLQTTAARRADLRSSIRQAPLVASGLQTTLAGLGGTLRAADAIVTRLNRVAPAVAPTLAALQPAVLSTSKLLVRARPLLRSLRPVVSGLAGTAVDGVPLIDQLRPSLDRLERQIIPGLAKKDRRTGKSTSVMIGGFAAGFGGIASQRDQNGHFIRFPATVTNTTAYLPCSSNLIDATAPSVLACDSLHDALQNYLQYFPLGPQPPNKR